MCFQCLSLFLSSVTSESLLDLVDANSEIEALANIPADCVLSVGLSIVLSFTVSSDIHWHLMTSNDIHRVTIVYHSILAVDGVLLPGSGVLLVGWVWQCRVDVLVLCLFPYLSGVALALGLSRLGLAWFLPARCWLKKILYWSVLLDTVQVDQGDRGLVVLLVLACGGSRPGCNGVVWVEIFCLTMVEWLSRQL